MKTSFVNFAGILILATMGVSSAANAQTWAHIPDQVTGALNEFDSNALKNINDQNYVKTGIYSRYTPGYKRTYFQIMNGVVTRTDDEYAADMGKPCALEVTDTNGETLLEIRVGDESDTSPARVTLSEENYVVHSSDNKLKITRSFNQLYQQKLYSDGGKKLASGRTTESLELEKNINQIVAAKITVQSTPSLRARFVFSEHKESHTLTCETQNN